MISKTINVLTLGVSYLFLECATCQTENDAASKQVAKQAEAQVTEDLQKIIKTMQYKWVRRSFGHLKEECFTDGDLGRFEENKIPEAIVEYEIKKSTEFSNLIKKVHALNQSARKAVLGKARKTYSKTNIEAFNESLPKNLTEAEKKAAKSKIITSPTTQSKAGQDAEKAIAQAIAKYVEDRIKVRDDPIEKGVVDGTIESEENHALPGKQKNPK